MQTPKLISSLLSRVLKEYDLAENAKRYEALNRWEEIVGAQVAAVTTPERISNGTLVVRVSSSVWRYELTMRKAEILTKIYKATGTNDIKEIVWK